MFISFFYVSRWKHWWPNGNSSSPTWKRCTWKGASGWIASSSRDRCSKSPPSKTIREFQPSMQYYPHCFVIISTSIIIVIIVVLLFILWTIERFCRVRLSWARLIDGFLVEVWPLEVSVERKAFVHILYISYVVLCFKTTAFHVNPHLNILSDKSYSFFFTAVCHAFRGCLSGLPRAVQFQFLVVEYTSSTPCPW